VIKMGLLRILISAKHKLACILEKFPEAGFHKRLNQLQ